MINTVIFDFDGTLVNTNNLILNSFNHIYCKYHNRNCDEDYVLSTFGEPLELTLKRDFSNFKYEEVVGSYRQYQVDKFEKEVSLFDTVSESLKYLHDKNIKIGFATARLIMSNCNVVKAV